MKLTFYGKVENGRLKYNNPERLAHYLSGLAGDVEISIGKQRKHRSNNQNRYYWGVIIYILSKELGYAEQEIHEALKMKFLCRDDSKIPIARSTTSLTTGEFEEYLMQIRAWASQFLGVYILQPNEVDNA